MLHVVYCRMVSGRHEYMYRCIVCVVMVCIGTFVNRDSDV